MNSMTRAQQEERNNGLIADIGIAVSGLAMVLSGLSFMLYAFRNDSGIGWAVVLVICGALACVGGGFIAGRERR